MLRSILHILYFSSIFRVEIFFYRIKFYVTKVYIIFGALNIYVPSVSPVVPRGLWRSSLTCAIGDTRKKKKRKWKRESSRNTERREIRAGKFDRPGPIVFWTRSAYLIKKSFFLDLVLSVSSNGNVRKGHEFKSSDTLSPSRKKTNRR